MDVTDRLLCAFHCHQLGRHRSNPKDPTHTHTGAWTFLIPVYEEHIRYNSVLGGIRCQYSEVPYTFFDFLWTMCVGGATSTDGRVVSTALCTHTTLPARSDWSREKACLSLRSDFILFIFPGKEGLIVPSSVSFLSMHLSFYYNITKCRLKEQIIIHELK